MRNGRTRDAWIWIVPVLTVLLAHVLTGESSALVRMLVIVAFLFAGMKVVVFFYTSKEKRPGGKNLGWFLFWPGMRPELFAKGPEPAGLSSGDLLRKGSLRFLTGLLFLFLARMQLPFLVRMVLVMAGWSLLLHFGLFAMVTVYYRAKGWKVRQPFYDPWKAISLGDFWSRRWNRIFSEMLALSVYRPVASLRGPGISVLAVFAVSGLLHEAAISLPVNTGYGGPTIYFLIQGCMVLAEGRLTKQGFPRALVFAMILLPLPLLFPMSFVREVMMPLACFFET